MGRFIRIAVATVTVALVFASTFNAAIGHVDVAIILAVGAPLGISAWGFARAGHHEAAVVLISSVLIAAVTLMLYISSLGVHDLAIIAYTGVLVFDALLLSRRAFLVMAALTLGSGTLIFALQLAGLTRGVLGGLAGWPALVDFLLINGVIAGLARLITERLFGTLGEAHHATVNDPATGLANRASFLMIASLRLAQREEPPGLAVLAVADLNAFRRVNHVVGHAAGDRILIEASRRVCEVQPGALCGRIGDDEFALLATGLADDTEAVALARRVQAALAFDFSGVSVRAAVGYSRFPQDAHGIDGLLLAADSSLAQAKAGEGGGFAGTEVPG